MKKTILILLLSLFVISCNNKVESDVTTYKPEFVSENPTCGDIIIDSNSVQFGSDAAEGSGRVVSKQGYKGISQIRATVDFSHLSSDFVVNTFYMINCRKFCIKVKSNIKKYAKVIFQYAST